MKGKPSKKATKGFVTISVVVALGLLLFAMMIAAFKRALVSQEIERTVQLQVDYGQREDALVRAIVGQVPEMVVANMQDGSSNSTGGLRWRQVFENAAEFANVDQSGNVASDGLFAAINQPTAINVNVAEQNINDYRTVVSCVGDDRPDVAGAAYRGGRPRAGIDSLGNRLPPTLSYRNGNMPGSLANNFPILSPRLYYGSNWGSRIDSGLGASSLNVFDRFTSIPYPEIHFGYAAPGDFFIAKHNWWAFDINLSAPQADITDVAQVAKSYCLSLYEVPSQLAITADGFAKIGEYRDGTAWGGNVTVEGGIYGDDIDVKGGSYDRLTAKRGLSLNGGGAKDSEGAIDNTYYTTADGRERYEVDRAGKLLPISLAGDSGRVAFVPVDVGFAFYDVFHGGVTAGSEQDVWGDWRWSEYSRGAGRCDMRVIVTEVVGSGDETPTTIEFYYRDRSITDGKELWELEGPITFSKVPAGGELLWPDDDGTTTGEAFPFHATPTANESAVLEVNIERIPQFLADNGIDIAFNKSLVVNVDSSGAAAGSAAVIPTAPSEVLTNGLLPDTQCAVVLKEGANLTDFERGFSVVTNLRLYIDTNLNEFSFTDVGKGLPANFSYTGNYFPPVSIFAPEVRYGSDASGRDLIFDGATGKYGKNDAGEDATNRDGVLELRQGGGTVDTSRITATLKPIQHPAEVPPITLMNWLIVAQPVSD